jgi:ligand-binding sensor domain-containing protein
LEPWDGGVNKFDGTRITHFTEKEGLSSNQVGSILKDKKGSLWLCTAFGFNKLKDNNSAELNQNFCLA